MADFFDRTESMFVEMKWQKKLRAQPALFWISSLETLWSNILFNFVLLINLIVAFFYPFENSVPGKILFNFFFISYNACLLNRAELLFFQSYLGLHLGIFYICNNVAKDIVHQSICSRTHTSTYILYWP